MSPPIWPGGKDFAFTIIDDTDHATVERVRPVYAHLQDLGLFTTKTVWIYPAPEHPNWGDGETLADGPYRDFIVDLQRRGFEIALHGVRGTSSTRDVIARGLARFEELLGAPPRIHANHGQNADNLYWGAVRVARWRRALHLHGTLAAASAGHDEDSPYFWGDLCREKVRYVRGTTFRDINTLGRDPYMPYRLPQYPYVNAWFSSSDGANPSRLRALLAPSRLDALVRQRGLCIVYTHFGVRGFLDERGDVASDIRELFRAVSRLNGWFRPASEILDFLAIGGPRELTIVQDARLRVRARLERA